MCVCIKSSHYNIICSYAHKQESTILQNSKIGSPRTPEQHIRQWRRERLDERKNLRQCAGLFLVSHPPKSLSKSYPNFTAAIVLKPKTTDCISLHYYYTLTLCTCVFFISYHMMWPTNSGLVLREDIISVIKYEYWCVYVLYNQVYWIYCALYSEVLHAYNELFCRFHFHF